MKMTKLLSMLLALLLFASCAAAEGAATRINLIPPNGWTADAAESIRIVIDTDAAVGTYTVECRMDEGPWEDVTAYFSDNRYDYTIQENGRLHVKVTDQGGHETTADLAVKCFDRAAPRVSAAINGSTLHITADDQLSGVAGVQINSLLYTTIDSNGLDIPLTAELSHFEKVSVRAFDYCGNFSDLVSLDNPCFEAEATPTPMPVTTTKPTSAPSGGSDSTTASTAKPTAQAPATPNATVGSTVQNTPNLSDWLAGIYIPSVPTATPVVTEVPMPTPVIQTEYITLGPGMPYTPDGNGHTLDMLYSAYSNKQFITIETKNGNKFFLVIDYDKPIDEDAELYQTYFLNMVDERDLLSLLDENELSALASPTPEIIYVTPEPTRVPVPTVVPTEAPVTDPPQNPKTDPMVAMAALAAILVLGGVGAFVLLKQKGGTQRKPVSDYGFDDDDEDEDDEEEESKP